VPIVRKDADISNLHSRQYQDVNNVLDIFVRGQTSLHVLRAVEPTLRFGVTLDNFLESISGQSLPKCKYQNTTLDYKCVNLVSRKQLGEAIVALEHSKGESSL
jgi:chondroitin polymerizing factor